MNQGFSLACWCGSSSGRQQFRTSAFGLVRCVSCGCYRIDPPPISRDEEAANFYTCYYDRPKKSPAKPEATRSSRFWDVVRQEASLAQLGESVADIGCGEGHLCNELREAGCTRVVGLDVSRTRVNVHACSIPKSNSTIGRSSRPAWRRRPSIS